MTGTSIHFETDGPVAIVTIDRPEVANAIDRPSAEALADAFHCFDDDQRLAVAVLTGSEGKFSAGVDIKAAYEQDAQRTSRVSPYGDGPAGPTRLLLSKPVIAAIEHHALAAGLELALWCDLRVAAEDAIFGVYCRRWGIPLMDGGTVRLPRLIGHSHALDLILTGRPVSGDEALRVGLANRIVPHGQALAGAVELAHQLASLPQAALRSDRLASYEQWPLELPHALAVEYAHGVSTLDGDEVRRGLEEYSSGRWRTERSASPQQTSKRAGRRAP